MLGWALVGVQAGSVLEIHRFTGNTLSDTHSNDQAEKYDRLALVVVGLNDASGFTFTFGSGNLTAEIMLPTQDWAARVGRRTTLSVFSYGYTWMVQSFLHQTVPALHRSGASTHQTGCDLWEKTYRAAVINHSYVDGRTG